MFNLKKSKIQIKIPFLQKEFLQKINNNKIGILQKTNNNKIEMIYLFYMILGITIGSFIYCIKL